MRKILLALLIGLVILAGCSTKSENYTLTSTEVIDKMEDKDSFLIYFTSKTCSVCKIFTPVYEDVRSEYGEYMYALDVGNENSKNQEDLMRLLNDYTGAVNATPTVVAIVDGKPVQTFVGAMKYSELENVLTSYKIVE